MAVRFSAHQITVTPTVIARPRRDALGITSEIASFCSVKMSTESLPIYGPPEGSDFVDISDIFLDAAQGMLCD